MEPSLSGSSCMLLYILEIVVASRGFYPHILSEIQKVQRIFMLIHEIDEVKSCLILLRSFLFFDSEKLSFR